MLLRIYSFTILTIEAISKLLMISTCFSVDYEYPLFIYPIVFREARYIFNPDGFVHWKLFLSVWRIANGDHA